MTYNNVRQRLEKSFEIKQNAMSSQEISSTEGVGTMSESGSV